MLRRYYRHLCTLAILEELGGKKRRRTQRLMMKLLRLPIRSCYDEFGRHE